MAQLARGGTLHSRTTAGAGGAGWGCYGPRHAPPTTGKGGSCCTPGVGRGQGQAGRRGRWKREKHPGSAGRQPPHPGLGAPSLSPSLSPLPHTPGTCGARDLDSRG